MAKYPSLAAKNEALLPVDCVYIIMKTWYLYANNVPYSFYVIHLSIFLLHYIQVTFPCGSNQGLLGILIYSKHRDGPRLCTVLFLLHAGHKELSKCPPSQAHSKGNQPFYSIIVEDSAELGEVLWAPLDNFNL